MEMLPDSHKDKTYGQSVLGNMFLQHFYMSGNLEHVQKAIQIHERIVDSTTNDHMDRIKIISNLGNALQCRFEHLGDETDILKSIQLHRLALDLSNHIKAACHLNLGKSLLAYYIQLGDTKFLQDSISHLETALNVDKDMDYDQAECFSALGDAWRQKCAVMIITKDIIKAIIMIQEKSIEIISQNHSRKNKYLTSLGTSWRLQYEVLGNITDLKNALEKQSTAVNMTFETHPNRAMYLNHLGNTMLCYCDYLKDNLQIDLAILNHQTAVNITPKEHPRKSIYLSNLGNAFMQCFKQFELISDLDKAIVYYQASVNITPKQYPDRSMHYNCFANALSTRFSVCGDLSDINYAIINHQIAVAITPIGYFNRARHLCNFGTSLRDRFEYFENKQDLDDAISNIENAVNIIPEKHFQKAILLNALGTVLSVRYQYLQNITDINDSIIHQQIAVDIAFQDDNKALYLNNLGNYFLYRFMHLRNSLDLDCAVLNHETATTFISNKNNSNKSKYFSNLASSLQCRYEYLGELSDLNNAIIAHQIAINSVSLTHSQKHIYLYGYAVSLRSRFEFLGDLCDIDNAISNQEIALNIVSKQYFNRSSYLSNLGNSLLERFQKTKDDSDLANSIEYHYKAINCISPDHYNLSTYLASLGNAFFISYQYSRDQSILEKAILNWFSSASQTVGSFQVRFKSAILWAQWRHKCDNTSIPSVLDAYSAAINLLPRLPVMGNYIHIRYKELLLAKTIGCDAAAAAIDTHDFSKALEWLEQGRSVIWNQNMQLHIPLDILSHTNPELAQRMSQISKQLEYPDLDQSTNRYIQKQHALAKEWEDLVHKAQRLPGFENFMKLPQFNILRDACSVGIIVVLNISDHRCDALILKSPEEPVYHVELTLFSHEKATNLQTKLHGLLQRKGLYRDQQRDERHIRPKFVVVEDENETFRSILKDLWRYVVKPVLDALSLEVRNNSVRASISEYSSCILL